MLTLFEELYLLTIHEDKGTLLPSKADALRSGLAGAILAELALLKKIGLKDNQRLELLDPSPSDDELLTKALETLAAAQKERKFGYWIDVFSQKPKKMRRRMAERLVQKEVVTQEEDRLLWVIPYASSADPNTSAKVGMKNRIRALVLASAQAEPREIALLSLVKACDYLDLIFVRDECKLAGRRIHELVVGEALKNPVLQTVEVIAAAIEAVVEED